MRDSWNVSTIVDELVKRDIPPLAPDVWDVWYNNLGTILKSDAKTPQRAFIGKDRYDRMMKSAPTTAVVRSPYISGLLVTIDYDDRERLDFQ